MKLLGTNRPPVLYLAALAVLAVTSTVRSETQRRIAAGDTAPAFTAVGVHDKECRYTPGEGRPLLLAYLSSEQPRSVNAWQDLTRILSELPPEKVATLCGAAVFSDPTNGLYMKLSKDPEQGLLAVLADENYRLWGTFGVIATPTVIVADRQGKVLVVKAGYSYDFEPVVRAYLEQALGLRAEVDTKQVGRVSALKNNSASARALRHERMADMLQGKGQNKLAVRELQKAMEIDPNSVSTAVRLGELLCREVEPDAAIAAVERWRDDVSLPRGQRAAVLQTLGWAYRQKGRIAEAGQLLEAARAIAPKSARTLFELAEVAREQKDTERALTLYREAARLLLDEPRSLKER